MWYGNPFFFFLFVSFLPSLSLSLEGGFSSSISRGRAGGGQNSISFDLFGAFKTTSSSNGSSNGGFASFPSVSSSDKQPHPPHATGTTAAASSSSSSGLEPFATFPPLNTGTTSTQLAQVSDGVVLFSLLLNSVTEHFTFSSSSHSR